MRKEIITNLSTNVDKEIVESLVTSYEEVVTHFRKGNLESCLTSAGKFVEHTLRAIEFIRTGKTLPEIRSVPSTIKAIEKDQNLDESIRILIPRIAYGMIYEIRSKRGAVHVKEIDPKIIDATLSVHAASWIIAELIRQYHTADESNIYDCMNTLMRGYLPFIEVFNGEPVVTKKVPCDIELLLLLSKCVFRCKLNTDSVPN